MSIKTKIVTVAAALALIAGIGAAGARTANAATRQCGSVCSNLYSRAFGSAFVLEALPQAGRPTTLAKASGANQGEDFIIDNLGTVADFHTAGLISGGLSALYGGLSVYEIEFTPAGSATGMCLGVGTAPRAGTPVVLEPCGVTAKTVWIFDPVPGSTYGALISGATDRNFRHPYSLTVLRAGSPLVTAPLAINAPASVVSHQLWSRDTGVLPLS